MCPTTGPDERDELAAWHYGTLAFWVALAGVIAVALFLVLHSLVGHGPAIVLAAIAAVVLSACGYGWRAGNPSRFRVAVAGALGGILGLGALHIIPLLH